MKFNNLKDVYKRPQKAREYWRNQAEKTDRDFGKIVDRALYNHSWCVTVKSFIEGGLISNQSKVLEVGCGWGRILVGLRKFCPKARIVGIDITEDFVEKARFVLEQEFGKCDVTVVQGDAMELDFEDESFDTVVTSRVLQYVSDPVASVRNIHRILRKRGRVVVCLPNKWNPVRMATYRTKLYTPKDTIRWFETVGFKIVMWKTINYFPSTMYAFRGNNEIVQTLENTFQKLPFIKRLGALSCVVGEKL